MSDHIEQFKALAKELEPHERTATEIKVKMLSLVHQMATEKVTGAFSDANVLRIRTIAELKPNDLARNTDAAITEIQKANLKPDLIIIDEARMTIILAIPGSNSPSQTKTCRQRQK